MWGIFSEFLCNMLICVVFFYMIFVQFLGVIICLNNPYFTMCRIANQKNPHIKNFGAFDLFVTTIGGVHQEPYLMQGTPKS